MPCGFLRLMALLNLGKQDSRYISSLRMLNRVFPRTVAMHTPVAIRIDQIHGVARRDAVQEPGTEQRSAE